jgi:glutaredoxin-related protein
MARVNLYVSSTSPETEEIKNYLSNRGIDFHVYDISSDVHAHKLMIEATRGAGGPPVVEVGHQVVLGFDKERLEEAINYELH